MELPAPVQLLVALSDLKAVRAVTTAFNAGLPKTGPLGTIPAGAKPFYILDHRPAPSVGVTNSASRDSYISGGASAFAAASYGPISGYFPFADPVSVVAAPLRTVPLYATDASVGGDVGLEHAIPRSRSPIQPPWRVLPWEQPPAVCVEVKRVVVMTDLISKGSLVDLFV